MKSFKEFCVKELQYKLNEVSYQPVDIEWYYKRDNSWYGTFVVDNIDYDISIARETTNIDELDQFVISSFKFARPDLKDPHSFAKDFNKPMVVANTVATALLEYLKKENIDILIIKSYNIEHSRVNKYRTIAKMLTKRVFTIFDEVSHGNYIYFILHKSSKSHKALLTKDIQDKLLNKL